MRPYDTSRRLEFDDGPAFSVFYAAYHDTVFRMLRVQGASRVDAEDLTHDTLLRAWPHRQDFDDEVHERRYVMMTARNLLTDLRRRTAVRAVLTEQLDLLPAQGGAPDANLLRAETIRALWAALRRLAPRDRQLLLDTDVHQLADDELVEVYDCRHSALRVRRHRARLAVRAALGPDYAPALPVVAFRRVRDGIASAMRTLQDGIAALCAHPQPLAVMLTAMTMVAAPFNGPLGPPALAYADSEVLVPRPAGAFIGPAPAHDRNASDRASRAGIGRDKRFSPTPVTPSRPDTHTDLPKVCVGDRCTPGGSRGDQDVVTLHLPEPFGDKTFGTDAAPVCQVTNQAPDAGLVSCHTDGDPDYRVPPRQHH